MANLHQGVAFSPQTTLSENIGAADTIIKVSDSSVFPDPPNYATIGTDELGETIEYAAKAEGLLSGCTRGVEGTAKSWQKGDVIARNFTAKDHNDMISAVTTAQQTANTAASAAEAAQSSANTAQESANNAQSTANAAKTTAEAALPKSGGVMTNAITFNPPGTHHVLIAFPAVDNIIVLNGNSIISTSDWGTTAMPVRLNGISDPLTSFDAANKRYVDSSIVRQNLLDNAYFVHPVNQRGQTNYSGIGYTIDRWKVVIASSSLDVSNGITLNAGNEFGLIQQFFEATLYSALLGKTVTLSVMFSDGSIRQTTQAFPSTKPTSAQPLCNIPYPDGAITIYASADKCLLQIYVNANSAVSLKAIKLEIGSTQTLAYQENGEWALNEIPDYATELLKCQRYFIGNKLITAPSYNNRYAILPIPIKMRSLPTILGTVNVYTAVTNTYVPNKTAVVESNNYENCLLLHVDNMTENFVITLQNGLSAEL